MRWNTRPPRDGGRRLRYPPRTVAARRSRARPRAASRVAKRVRTGRAVEGGARGSNGGDGACARRGGAGAFPATLARGLPLAPGLKPRSSPSRTERLQPRSRTFRGFRRFDFAFRLPFFRPWGTLQRGWCVFAFDARAACARVCVHDGASSLSRHLLSFGRFMRSSSACTPTARRESTHSTRASSRERRDERRDERRPRPRRAQRVGPSAPQLMLGGGPSWVTSASFHRVAMMDARPCGAGPTGRLAGSTSSLRRARLFSCPLAPRPL